MRIWIGTSGFQYKEWKGKFYPEDLSLAKMLGYYAERFPTTEINYTFRHTPSLKTIDNWRARTPEAFRFSCKAPQSVTHFAKLRDCAEKIAFFQQAIAPLGDKSGAVLFQLPPSFKADLAVLQGFLKTLPPGMQAAFEFRHPSWFAEPIYAALRDARAALCIAEDEKLATPAVATADFGYLRLRREDYRPADLKRWAAWIKQQTAQWSDVHIYLKHEEQGLGPAFARVLQEELNVLPPSR